MNFLEQARNVQSVGAANSKNDTVLAHITPKEAAILKLLGGSGRRDPKTGALHFEDDTDGSEAGWGGEDNSRDAGESYGGGKSVGGFGDADTEARDYSDAADALSGNEPGTSWGSRDGHGVNTYQSGATAPYREAQTPEQIAAQQQNYNDTMMFNYQNQLQTKPKLDLGVKDALALGASVFTMNPSPSAKVTGPKVASYLSNKNAWGDENERLGLSSPNAYTNEAGPFQSSPTRTPSEPMGGNGAGYAALGLGSAALGGGLGYALGSTGSSNKSTQMYTDPVTGQLLPYLDAGLNERVANENLDNTIANQLRAQDDLNARRGMGMSTMQDASRASLGLSTAQTRNANRLTAQEIQAQRDLAAQTAAKQDALAQANLRYLQGVQDDKNRNAWISAAGDVAGSIDWDSLF